MIEEKFRNKHSEELRKRLLSVLDSEKNKNINALFFSGGVDSTTILFALLELGRKPDLISFKLKDIESKDYLIGKEIADYYGLNYICVELPSDREGILKDVIDIIPELNYPLKTHIQCSIPFKYMSPVLSKLGHTKAFTGLYAGFIFGFNKKTNMAYKEHGEEFTRNLRIKMMNNVKISDYDIEKISLLYGIELITPYKGSDFSDWMMHLPYKELHTGKPKSIAVDAFKEYWLLNDKKWYRSGNNLQIVSGIRERHDELLLNDAELNPSDAKGIIAIYNNLRKRINISNISEWINETDS